MKLSFTRNTKMQLFRDTTLAAAVATTFGLTIYSMITHDPYAITLLVLFSILLAYDMFFTLVSAIQVNKSIQAVAEINRQYDTVIAPELDNLKSALSDLKSLTSIEIEHLSNELTLANSRSTQDVDDYITKSIEFVATTTRKDINTIADELAAVKGEVANLQMANGFKKLK